MDSSDTTRSSVGIRISSDPDKTEITGPTGRAKEAASLTFGMLLVSDLVPESHAGDLAEASQIHRIDKNRFAGFLHDTSPTLALEVKNSVRSQPRLLDISLTFRALDDFTPVGVLQQIPSLRQLAGIRDVVAETRAGKVDPGEFIDRLSPFGIEPDWAEELHRTLFRRVEKRQRTGGTEPRPTGTSGDSSALDRILEMVDAGGEGGPAPASSPQQPPSEGLIGSLVSAVSEAGRPPVDTSSAEKVIEDIEGVVSRQLRIVLENERFRELEAAWRGLKFLVDRTDFRSDITLDVLPASKKNLAEALRSQVLIPEHSGERDVPLSLIVLGYEFDQSDGDMDLLAEVADTAESLQTVALGSLSPRFFGSDEPPTLTRLPSIRQHLAGPEYIAWNKLTEQSSAGYLALGVPPIVLRETHNSRPSWFALSDSPVLWGSASIGVAALVAQRVSESGWPTFVTGHDKCSLEEMSLWKSRSGPIPLSATFSESKQLELSDAGFTVLSCTPGKDSVYVSHAPTIAITRRFEDQEMNRLAENIRQMDSMLFISRVAHFLICEQHRAGAAPSIEVAATNLRARLCSFLGITNDPRREDHVTVDEDPESSSAERWALRVGIRSPAALLPRSVGFSVGFSVDRPQGGGGEL